MPSKRNIRIGNVSGATGDHWNAMQRMAISGDVDVITGDWLSEMNIAWNAIIKAENPELGYEAGFLTQLEESIDDIVSKGIKVITNAGALNTTSLTVKVEEMCKRKGHEKVVIASVVGDDISSLLAQPTQRKAFGFSHLDHEDQSLENQNLASEAHCAVAYLGAQGIVAALQAGADIVICGRVTDASPVIGAAAWWYGWRQDSLDELAGALIAGHLIECGPYVTGADFSGFKEFPPDLVDLGFGIAEVLPTGSCFITKPESSNGVVNKFNVTAQLLYELQGEMYLNPDVVADISRVQVEETAQPNRVYVSGVVGLPPPSTTKAMIAANGGYQCETTFYINGLDVAEKAQMMKSQLEHMFKDCNFSKLSIELYGTPAVDPRSQQAGTVFLRIFAQARKKEDVSALKFGNIVYALRMQSYPGRYGFQFIYFGISTPFSSLSLFTPSITAGLGFKDLRAQLMTVPPYAAAYVVTLLVSFSADHFNARSLHSAAFATIGAVGFMASALLPAHSYSARYGCLIVAASGAFSFIPPLLGWLSCNVHSTAAVGLVIAINVSIGAPGQIAGVWIYKADQAKRGYPTGHWTNAGLLLFVAVMCVGLRLYYGVLNRKMLRGWWDERRNEETL